MTSPCCERSFQLISESWEEEKWEKKKWVSKKIHTKAKRRESEIFITPKLLQTFEYSWSNLTVSFPATSARSKGVCGVKEVKKLKNAILKLDLFQCHSILGPKVIIKMELKELKIIRQNPLMQSFSWNKEPSKMNKPISLKNVLIHKHIIFKFTQTISSSKHSKWKVNKMI